MTGTASNGIELTGIDPLLRPRLADALHRWKVESFSVRRGLGGKSGASVYLVDAVTPTHNGQAVLKVSVASLKPEADKQEHVRSSRPGLRDRVPVVAHEFHEEQFSAILMSVVAGGLLEAQTLAASSPSAINLAAQMVGQSLFQEWNPQASFDTAAIAPKLLLESWLGNRMEPGRHLEDVVREVISGGRDTTSFNYRGVAYPNPLAFAHPDFAGNVPTVAPIRGLVHGDLHGENILISGSIPPTYYFIDFALANESAPLLFDHAYLELSYLLALRGRVTHQRWQEICTNLAGLLRPQDAAQVASSTDDQGPLWTLGMLRETIEKWASSKYPNRREDLKKQRLLARVAVGLNFASKRAFSGDNDEDRKVRFFCIIYAAQAAKEYFEYCKVTIATDGPAAKPEGEVPAPSNDRWRVVWEEAHNFPHDYGTYILVAGPDLSRLSPQKLSTLARLPWKLVVDFDPAGVEGNFAKVGMPVLLRRGVFTQAYPHQAASVDVRRGGCWFFANSNLPQSPGERRKPALWRHQTLPSLRQMVEHLYLSTVPEPVFVLILGDGFDEGQLRHAFTTIEEAAAGRVKGIIVSDDSEEATKRALLAESSDLVAVQCDVADLALGIHQMLGDDAGTSSLWLPVRDAASNTARLEPLDDTDAARFTGNVRLVPSTGSAYVREADDPEIADFLRGNTISWHELDLHKDVDRDVTSAAVSAVRDLLSGSPSDSFAIEHSPGAGGTTVALRLAWTIRDDFPVAVIKAFSEGAIDDIDYLFRLSNLPVLIVAEAAQVAGAHRDRLFEELKARNVRFVILDVRRRHHPRSTKGTVALDDPMSVGDASRFLNVYEPKAPAGRRSLVRNLATSASSSPFRSAFFFGLYTYEEQFTGTKTFVGGLLEELSAPSKLRLAQLALVSRFSQEKLPVAVFASLLGLSTSARQTHPAKLLGDSAAKLIMFDGRNVSVSHPLLAGEILEQFLSPSGSDLPLGWKNNLADFCIDFVTEVSSSEFRDSEQVRSILIDLFIERDDWSGLSDSPQFSPLILELPSPQSQRRVLEKLCAEFPEDAHFWNHLGRHINLRETGSYGEAEAALLRAVNLEPFNEVHHHGLGMVYRLEVKRRMSRPLVQGETLRMRLEVSEGLFEKAEESFATARRLNPTGKYPVVTPIQMTVETFERLASFSGEGSYQKFLLAPTYVSEWCRARIAKAETLMARLHHLEANSENSSYTVTYEARLEEIHGNFGSMVSGLSALLSRADIAKPPVRRMLTRAYIRENEDKTPNIDHLRAVVSLMKDNLRDEPSNGADVRNWFRAFRMVPEFTISEAIEQMTLWSLASESVDAAFYLYVLHFIQARLGIHKSLDESKKYLEVLKQNAPELLSRKSFEWWASDTLLRPCPLVHHSELGEWSHELDFFKGAGKLGVLKGRIDRIRSPQAGEINIDGLQAFFVPRSDFRPDTDRNAEVEFYLGFSYQGLRAWGVRRASR